MPEYGLYAGSYGLALERLLLPPIQAVIVGQGLPGRQLAAVANARYAVNKAVILLRPEQVMAENLPPLLAETLPQLPGFDRSSGQARALVCRGATCLPPATTPEVLIEQINAAV